MSCSHSGWPGHTKRPWMREANPEMYHKPASAAHAHNKVVIASLHELCTKFLKNKKQEKPAHTLIAYRSDTYTRGLSISLSLARSLPQAEESCVADGLAPGATYLQLLHLTAAGLVH